MAAAKMYFLSDEVTQECDWKLYFVDYPKIKDCNRTAMYALVNPERVVADYPKGFHEAHLCAIHGPVVLDMVNEGVV